jgi:hypothetical protein
VFRSVLEKEATRQGKEFIGRSSPTLFYLMSISSLSKNPGSLKKSTCDKHKGFGCKSQSGQIYDELAL